MNPVVVAAPVDGVAKEAGEPEGKAEEVLRGELVNLVGLGLPFTRTKSAVKRSKKSISGKVS